MQVRTDDEAGRILALRRYGILDRVEEPNFDAITAIVKDVLGVPICAVTLVDDQRVWANSGSGIAPVSVPRPDAFCDHVIRLGETLLVEDARQDPRFASIPFVVGDPHVRSYAGAPLVTPDGYCLGALCAIDRKPRRLSQTGIGLLQRFADLAVDQMELRMIAQRDFLTGLMSRRAFMESATSALGRGKRLSAALIVFDVDHFKRINDTHGHPVGDEVLETIARLCGEEVRPGDLIGRIGGEEFAIFAPRLSGGDALRLAERLRQAVAAHPFSCGPVTASFGVAPVCAGDSLDLRLAEADAALYRAKAAGRNCSVESGGVPALAA